MSEHLINRHWAIALALPYLRHASGELGVAR